jgi:hypothetical protein
MNMLLGSAYWGAVMKITQKNCMHSRADNRYRGLWRRNVRGHRLLGFYGHYDQGEKQQ